jgi:hypothetical protein
LQKKACFFVQNHPIIKNNDGITQYYKIAIHKKPHFFSNCGSMPRTHHNECLATLVLVAAAELLPGAEEHHGLGDDGGEHGQAHHQEHDLEQPARNTASPPGAEEHHRLGDDGSEHGQAHH